MINFYPPALASGNKPKRNYNGGEEISIHPLLRAGIRNVQGRLLKNHFYPPALASGNLIQTSFDDGIYFYPPALASGNDAYITYSGHYKISIHPLLRAGMGNTDTKAYRTDFYPPALASGNRIHLYLLENRQISIHPLLRAGIVREWYHRYLYISIHPLLRAGIVPQSHRVPLQISIHPLLRAGMLGGAFINVGKQFLSTRSCERE